MLVLQESQRKAEKELEVKAAEAKAAREAVEKIKNEAVADAAKKAKEAAETEAQEKAKKAQEEHEKALKKSKEAEETAKKAKKEAEEEAAKHKPTDDDKQAPIKFKDAVGRKFGFPWRHCKTWKVSAIEQIACATVRPNTLPGHGRPDSTSFPPRGTLWSARAGRSLRSRRTRWRDYFASGMGVRRQAGLVHHDAYVANGRRKERRSCTTATPSNADSSPRPTEKPIARLV